LEVWCLSYMSENYFGGYVTTQQKWREEKHKLLD
jgi:hypothetical protein